MKLISIIPGFEPKQDAALLDKAEALRPSLVHTFHEPVRCLKGDRDLSMEELAGTPLGKGERVLLDYGRHLVGRLSLRLNASGAHPDAPAMLRMAFAETLQELEGDPEAYGGWLSSSWIQREQIFADVLPCEIALPRRFAFRYVCVTVVDTSPKYALLIADAVCRAETSADESALRERAFPDEELRRIYDISLATLKACTQEVLEDGPKRDQRLWLGDLRLQALTTYRTFRSFDLVKRCLYLFAGTRFPDGRMSANVFTRPSPCADDTFLLDYALMYPISLLEYLEETGDSEALLDLYAPALEQVDWAIENAVDEEGILTPEQKEQCFIDWSDSLSRTASCQGVLICALDAAAALCDRYGERDRGKRYRLKARAMRRASLERFYAPEEGCFLSDGQISIHSQVWMTLAGVMPKDGAARAFDRAEAAPGPGMLTPYMHHYYVSALWEAGLGDQAEKHLRDYWGGMARAGADTYWECYVPGDLSASPYDSPLVNSYCHAWSCTPAYLIDRYLL